MHPFKIIFILFNVLLSQAAYAIDPSTLLPPTEAFKVAAKPTADGNVLITWDIADGYYVYRKKIAFNSKTANISIESADLPKGELKNDKLFGDMMIYRDQVSSLLTLKRPTSVSTFQLIVKHQGCSDAGLCYPPQKTRLMIQLPALATEPQGANSFSLGIDSALKGLSSFSPFKEQLLTADQAFQFFAQATDGENISVNWKIAEGYYLYREKVDLQLVDANSTQLLNYTIPNGIPKYDEAFGDVEIFHDSLSFNVPLSRQNITEHTLILKAKFQGCAERGVCYPPMEKTVHILLPEITAASSVKVAEIVATTPVKKKLAASEQDLIIQSLQQDSFVLTLLSFLGFGLLLAFTPCVFPMVPILSGIIVGQGKDITNRKAFLLSLSFVLASALTYTVFGILAAQFGSNLQATFQAPWIIYLFSGIFVVLAMAMFGFYELSLPHSLQSRLHNASDQHRDGSFMGAALMGVFSSLIVGPCVAAPLAAALMYIGQTGDVVLGGAALFMMGLGMGVPLLIIGSSAGSLLPKAGHWLNISKSIFGVIMLAVAVWMLERVIAPELSMLLWAMLCIIPAIYLRVLDPLPEVDSGWHKLWKGFGVILFTYGLLILIGLSAGNTNSLQPLKGLAMGATSTTAAEQKLVFKKVASLAELEQEIQIASNNGKWVMLDFYADWCISCKEMEHYTLNNPDVKKFLESFVVLQADITKNNDDDKALLKAFHLIGPPAILFFDLTQQERTNARIIGFQGPKTFMKHLKGLE